MLFDPKNIQQLNENILRRKIGRSELPYFLKNKGTKDEDSIPQVYIKSIPTLYQVYIKSISGPILMNVILFFKRNSDVLQFTGIKQMRRYK